MELLESLIFLSMAAGTSLLYAALGEIFTERAGILNLGIEGTLLISALSAFAAASTSGSLFLGVLTAMAAGIFCSLILALLTLSLRANQVMSGLSITLLASALAGFLGQRIGPHSNRNSLLDLTGPRFQPLEIPFLGEIPLAGAFFRQDILTYLLYLLVPLSWFFLYKSRYGLNLRALEESPRTAAAMGLKVKSEGYLYILLGGLLSGLAGAHLSLSFTPGWRENIIGGWGWIVIVLVLLSTRNPGRAFPAALLFGAVRAYQFLQNAGGNAIPSFFLNMLPYLIAIVVLILLSLSERMRKRFTPPNGLGISHLREDF